MRPIRRVWNAWRPCCAPRCARITSRWRPAAGTDRSGSISGNAAQILKDVMETLARQAEIPGRRGLVSTVLLQSAEDRSAAGSVHLLLIGMPRRRSGGRQLQVLRPDDSSAGQGDGRGEHVLELADVARPVVAAQAAPRLA